jgi:hypothetical protein
MRQTLHIFRKDVRLLWIPILAVLALSALSAWAGSFEEPDSASFDDHWTLPIAFARWLFWAFLVVAAVYQDRPAGDGQYWITRPYTWKSLVGAKLLLILACINLPYLLSDIVIIRAQGLTPVVSSLLARQFFVFTLWLMPVAALASTTTHLAQAALRAIVVSCVASIGLLVTSHRGLNDLHSLNWIHYGLLLSILATLCFCIVVWQYRWRRTTVAYGMMAAGAALLSVVWLKPPTRLIIAVATLAPEPPDLRGIRLSPEPQRGELACPAPHWGDWASWGLYRVEGLPEGTSARAVFADFDVLSPSTSASRSSLLTSPYEALTRDWICAVAERGAIANRSGGQSASGPIYADISVTAVLDVYRTGISVPFADHAGDRRMSDIGICSSRMNPLRGVSEVQCRAVAPSNVTIQSSRHRSGWLVWEDAWLENVARPSPVITGTVGDTKDFEGPAWNGGLNIERRVARIRRTIHLTNVRIAPIQR